MKILYEDNHTIVVNKRAGELVQPDPDGAPALEQEVKDYLRVKYNKAGDAFLGVVHRIDRPVSGVVLFAKTSKALVRLNEQLRERGFQKKYWAITEKRPPREADELVHYIVRNAKTNKSTAHANPTKDGQQAVLRYRLMKESDRYFLLEIELVTGRHHQIRAQLAAIGCVIKGDLKYGAARSNRNGGISLHSRSLSFTHPTTAERIEIIAPVPEGESIWQFFDLQAAEL